VALEWVESLIEILASSFSTNDVIDLDSMPPDVAMAAKARPRELDLWETAGNLIVELEELGWGELNPSNENDEIQIYSSIP
jgi:hypothetical protein